MTVREARRKGAKILSEVEEPFRSGTPALDADVLLQSITGCDKTALLFHGERELTPGEETQFFRCIQRRGTGLPVAYITGHKEFFGHDFVVTQDVLVPKPDTELLVERAVHHAMRAISKRPHEPLRICDLCTGSGCVGLSVMLALMENGIPRQELPQMTLSDISGAALSVAEENCARLLPEAVRASVTLSCGDLFQNVQGSFGIILANPPYVPSEEVDSLLLDGRAEPRLALDGDADGLSVIRRLVAEAPRHLLRGGVLLVESGEYNARETEALFVRHGFSGTAIHTDLAGSLRCTEGTFRP